MANEKLPQLPSLTAITGQDLFYVVDVSDTTDDPTGSSKGITRDDILKNITGLTIDGDIQITGNTYVTGKVGIGTTTPQFPLHVIASSSTIQYQSDSSGGSLALSGNTDIPRIDVLGDGGIGVSIGVIISGLTAATYASRGKPTDSFLRAGVVSNGLNIINAGPGVEDYIRFYAGKNADQGVSDIHIQGSGTTRGFVGISIDNPTAKLHITNTGTSNSFLVEDSTNPDSTPFVIDASGKVGIGIALQQRS